MSCVIFLCSVSSYQEPFVSKVEKWRHKVCCGREKRWLKRGFLTIWIKWINCFANDSLLWHSKQATENEKRLKQASIICGFDDSWCFTGGSIHSAFCFLASLKQQNFDAFLISRKNIYILKVLSLKSIYKTPFLFRA